MIRHAHPSYQPAPRRRLLELAGAIRRRLDPRPTDAYRRR